MRKKKKLPVFCSLLASSSLYYTILCISNYFSILIKKSWQRKVLLQEFFYWCLPTEMHSSLPELNLLLEWSLNCKCDLSMSCREVNSEGISVWIHLLVLEKVIRLLLHEVVCSISLQFCIKEPLMENNEAKH